MNINMIQKLVFAKNIKLIILSIFCYACYFHNEFFQAVFISFGVFYFSKKGNGKSSEIQKKK